MNNQQNNTQNLARYIDHTNLSPTASQEVIIKLCNEAIEYGFKSVCIHPNYIELAKELLKDTNVLICTVIGFPLGQNTTLTKIFETVDAVNKGADEIDMVINIADLKSRNSTKIIYEINKVALASGNRTLKVIVETCLLSYEDKLYAVEIISKSRAAYIKTSTGFSKSGADIDDIKLWKQWIDKNHSLLLIKAAGGIRNNQDLVDFIASGASRIGTSKGIELLNNDQKEFLQVNTNERKTLNLDLNFIDVDGVNIKKNNMTNKNSSSSNPKTIPTINNEKNYNIPKKEKTTNFANNKNISSATKINNESNKTKYSQKIIKHKQENSY